MISQSLCPNCKNSIGINGNHGCNNTICKFEWNENGSRTVKFTLFDKEIEIQKSQTYTNALMAKKNFDDDELDCCVLLSQKDLNEFLLMLTNKEKKKWNDYINNLKNEPIEDEEDN